VGPNSAVRTARAWRRAAFRRSAAAVAAAIVWSMRSARHW